MTVCSGLVAVCGCPWQSVAICSGLVAILWRFAVVCSGLQWFGGSNRSIQMAVFRKITDLRAGAAFLRFIRYIRRSFPVHMACPYHRRGFLVPNIPSVPQKPVLSTEGFWKCVAYRRKPFWARYAYSVPEEAFYGTECSQTCWTGTSCELLSDFLSLFFEHNIIKWNLLLILVVKTLKAGRITCVSSFLSSLFASTALIFDWWTALFFENDLS